MEQLIQEIRDKFRARFKSEPLVVVSPGRVNLIGEHTDYNEGFVLPGAIDRAIVLAVALRPDTVCHFVSHDFGQEYRCDIHELSRSPLRWPNYLEGVVDQFMKRGYRIQGFHCVFGGNIPIGAGLSSSAALECGLAFALNSVFGFKLDKLSLVKLAQLAENEFVGVRCGIMDQFISIHGREKNLLKLDCRSLEAEYIPFERADLRIIVCDSLVRRELASSEYNVRREQCEKGVEILRKFMPEMRSLRDANLGLLEEHKTEFDPVVFRRCEYVIQENSRVEGACQDLLAGDVARFGERMCASHSGLRDGYEVSSPELDTLVEAALKIKGVLGARMMGAGFGGCTINLVEEGCVAEFSESVSRDYQASTGKTPNIHVVQIKGGTRALTY